MYGNQMRKSKAPSIKLNNLPPLPPAAAASASILSHQAKPSPKEAAKLVKKFDDEANTVADLLADKKPLQRHLQIHPHDPNASSGTSGEGDRVWAKSELYKICAAYKWKPPCFECCKQEGPPHLRLFSFKVTVEIGGEEEGVDLECYGAPKSKKTSAAEDAAEGALWYLKHIGYFPLNKLRKKGKTQTTTST